MTKVIKWCAVCRKLHPPFGQSGKWYCRKHLPVDYFKFRDTEAKRREPTSTKFNG